MKNLLPIFFIITLGHSNSFNEKMVTILTEPPGVEVYLNGKSIGISPCTIQLKNGLLTSKKMIKVEKKGYKSEIFKLNQKINPFIGCAGLGCGIFTGIGLVTLLWATEFEDSYHFYLQPINEIKKQYDPITGKLIK